MYVEKLNELEIKDLAFKVVVSLAHKNPNLTYQLKEVSSITKVKDILYFEILCLQGEKDLKTLHVHATDNGVYVDNSYNQEASDYLSNVINEIERIIATYSNENSNEI